MSSLSRSVTKLLHHGKGWTTAGPLEGCGPYNEALEILPLRLLDELDCKTIGQSSDHATDAGSHRQRRSDRRLQLSGDGYTGSRHIDDEA